MYIHPSLMMMLGFVLNFASERNITVCITSIIRTPEENKAVGAKSLTHVQGRALDVSLRPEFGWKNSDLQELEEKLLEKFSDVAALAFVGDSDHGDSSGLVPRPMVVHDAGSGSHIHFQVRP